MRLVSLLVAFALGIVTDHKTAAGAAIVNTLGPLRHAVAGSSEPNDRRYLVIVPAQCWERLVQTAPKVGHVPDEIRRSRPKRSRSKAP
jgi:hypothetical protein